MFNIMKLILLLEYKPHASLLQKEISTLWILFEYFSDGHNSLVNNHELLLTKPARFCAAETLLKLGFYSIRSQNGNGCIITCCLQNYKRSLFLSEKDLVDCML